MNTNPDDLGELRLDGQAALVTGAASGIGYVVASTLGHHGAGVVLFDRDRTKVEQAAGELSSSGVDAISVVGDVTDPDAATSAVETAVARWGHLDILVNSAGVAGRSRPVTELDDADWMDVIDVNLHGTFYFCRAAARAMVSRTYGRIVNIASIAGKEGNPNAAPYSASKAAVIGLTKSLGKELATSGVLVNAIAPAVIETDILTQISDEHVEYMRSKIPMGRFGQPIEVARLVTFLASPHLSFSTAAVYDISGGRATY